MNRHRFYLLHVWMEGIEGKNAEAQVQASLEEPRTGSRWGFNDMESLAEFVTTVLTEDFLGKSTESGAARTERNLPDVSEDKRKGVEKSIEASTGAD